MPPKPHRQVAYSGKKKREQLRERNARKQPLDKSDFFLNIGKRNTVPPLDSHFVAGEITTTEDFQHTQHEQTRLVSQFKQLTPAEIQQGRLQSMKPFHRLPKSALEVDNHQAEKIEIPIRPQWSYDMTKEQVDEREKESFDQWLTTITEKYKDQEISYFERNLEVWRQLWRVMEISDVILIIMDIRNPLLHFPLSLYEYVTETLNRKVIGVFNKVDLVSKFTVFAWTKYFEETYPKIRIATFSCYPSDDRLLDDTCTYALKSRTKRRKSTYYHAQGVKQILSLCKEMVDKPVHVDWASLIKKYDEDNDELKREESEDDSDSDTGSTAGLDDEFSGVLQVTTEEVKPHHKYITIGLVGHPNVGKSSLINSIMQKTVVSTSQTPGHTKHFQTIHINENVRLCDSPGLVFPALVPRTLQILSGLYPIAQVQEPYTCIQYLAEHIELEKILSLKPPVDKEDLDRFEWTAWFICEAYAEQRGFHIAKTADYDGYRAANVILRMVTDGRILLSFKPPGFFSTTRYEQMRVADADKKLEESDEEEEEEGRVDLLASRRYDYSVLLSDSE
ncbi:P-loop containing nucleoside triphosphate hydrolase protein [Pilobolus umbonatus]|nr:P-loop containing nucleoside triphosphate hydrolase protein [Pilobolus umbonatus]